MWRRLVVLAAALAVSIPVSIVVAAAPAFASAPSCSIAAVAHWSTQRSYNYAPGHWCMTDGRAEVVWQSDGNLVWYASNGHVFWRSNTCYSCNWTSLTGASRLSFQVDGNIVVYRSDGHALWAIGASDNRRSTTNFYWELYERQNRCLHTMYALEQSQVDPDPSLTRVLDHKEYCY